MDARSRGRGGGLYLGRRKPWSGGCGSPGRPRAQLRCFEFDDPASVDALRAIREQGIKVVLATDNMDAFSRWTVPALHLGGIFDAILDSASLGVLKDERVGAHSPFFGPWLTDQRIAPSEAVLIDDSPPAWAAAIGLEIRRVDHPGKLASVLTQLGLALGTGASDATMGW